MKNPRTSAAPKDIYATITNQLIAAIDTNPGEWTMPWRRTGHSMRLPKNALSKKHYRGINTVVLWMTANERGYDSELWGTYKQWAEHDAQVRKGEKGALIVFYKTYKAKPAGGDTDDDGTRRAARSLTVFNASQVDGFNDPDHAGDNITTQQGSTQSFDNAERFITATQARFQYGGDRAYYRLSTDHIQMPLRASFTGTKTMSAEEAFVATKLHELLHYSGAPHRLNREFGKRFGDTAYAFEELVAEIGSCMLMADLSITADPRADHAEYLHGWLEILKNDKRAIFTAAAKAQEAVEFLKSFQNQATALASEIPLEAAA